MFIFRWMATHSGKATLPFFVVFPTSLFNQWWSTLKGKEQILTELSLFLIEILPKEAKKGVKAASPEKGGVHISD